MSESEDESSRDSDSSGRQTPIVRSRSASVESTSTARSNSRTSDRSDRSRSPVEDAEKRSLKAENLALKQELAKMAHIIREQQHRIQNLESQIQAQHKESMEKLASISQQIANSQDSKRRKTREKPQEKSQEPMEVEKIPQETRGKMPPIPEPQTPGPSREKPRAKSPEKEKPEEDEKTPKIPPVIIRKQETWRQVSQKLDKARIRWGKARLISDGIQVFPKTVEDYRKMTKMLTEDKHEYHTYSLPEDKLLRVVIRGLPDGIPLEDVKDDLQSQGYSPTSVQRMTNRRTKKPMPLVLVQLPEKDGKVLEVNRCCGLVVRTELQRAAPAVSQCHRCQRFGHAQSKCSATPRCVKCGGTHHSGDCKKPSTTPAKCANCEGAHPASFRGCPKYPKKKTQEPPRPAPRGTSTQVTHPPRPKATGAKTFAEAAKQAKPGPGKTTPAPAPTPAADLTAMLAQMQQMCSAMSAFFAKMPVLVHG